MFKKTKTARTSLSNLDGQRVAPLANDELRRAVGALPRTITSGACTLNCDDWCDCD